MFSSTAAKRKPRDVYFDAFVWQRRIVSGKCLYCIRNQSKQTRRWKWHFRRRLKPPCRASDMEGRSEARCGWLENNIFIRLAICFPLLSSWCEWNLRYVIFFFQLDVVLFNNFMLKRFSWVFFLPVSLLYDFTFKFPKLTKASVVQRARSSCYEISPESSQSSPGRA